MSSSFRQKLGIAFLVFYSVVSLEGQQYEPGTFLYDQYMAAHTASGPGLAVFAPWSYVDLVYDNLPFVGKLPVLGKDGTSSYSHMSPVYLKEGNPMPPLYIVRPLPFHIPDPVEVVAVPLDEETLHGEQLFPKELMLPWEKKKLKPDGNAEVSDETNREKVSDPFEDIDASIKQGPAIPNSSPKAYGAKNLKILRKKLIEQMVRKNIASQ